MKTIFIAGASGAIGRRMLQILKHSDYKVFGTTRSQQKADELSAKGIEPIVLDVFDASAVHAAMQRVRPNVVVNQLTDLPYGLDPTLMGQARVRNARVRKEGTKNLVDAAIAAGAQQLISQSIAWVYAAGPEPHSESDPLEPPEGPPAVTLEGVYALESLSLSSALRGAVLRYGMLYGPGTGQDGSDGLSIPLHVDAAAHAAVLAIAHAACGVYNIVEDNPHVANNKARKELVWTPDYRIEPA
jgi:nucleoside-diphosphate-sugar epimerase